MSTPTPVRPAARRGFGKWFAATGWRHLIGVALCIYAAFPLLYVLSASLNPNGTLLSSNGLFTEVGLRSYIDLFRNEQRPFAAWFGNTLVIGLTTAAASVFLGALAAYSFSRMRFTGRRFGLMSLLVVQIFPQLLAVVAIFILLTSLGEVYPMLGIDNQVALIMVYLGGALGVNTYLMYGFFNTVPVEIDEAAKIDGANAFQTLRKIIMPLLLVAVGPLLIASFAFNFNNFGLIYLLTGGGPFEGANTSIGSTDLLITYAFRLAFSGVSPNYGLASAVSIVIFAIVALMSYTGFRRTKQLEEIN